MAAAATSLLRNGAGASVVLVHDNDRREGDAQRGHTAQPGPGPICDSRARRTTRFHEATGRERKECEVRIGAMAC